MNVTDALEYNDEEKEKISVERVREESKMSIQFANENMDNSYVNDFEASLTDEIYRAIPFMETFEYRTGKLSRFINPLCISVVLVLLFLLLIIIAIGIDAFVGLDCAIHSKYCS